MENKPTIRTRKQDGLYYCEIIIADEVVYTTGRYIRWEKAAQAARATSYFKANK